MAIKKYKTSAQVDAPNLGDNTTLKTTDKSSLVNAVNELQTTAEAVSNKAGIYLPEAELSYTLKESYDNPYFLSPNLGFITDPKWKNIKWDNATTGEGYDTSNFGGNGYILSAIIGPNEKLKTLHDLTLYIAKFGVPSTLHVFFTEGYTFAQEPKGSSFDKDTIGGANTVQYQDSTVYINFPTTCIFYGPYKFNETTKRGELVLTQVDATTKRYDFTKGIQFPHRLSFDGVGFYRLVNFHISVGAINVRCPVRFDSGSINIISTPNTFNTVSAFLCGGGKLFVSSGVEISHRIDNTFTTAPNNRTLFNVEMGELLVHTPSPDINWSVDKFKLHIDGYCGAAYVKGRDTILNKVAFPYNQASGAFRIIK